jgi:hypothetical protein
MISVQASSGFRVRIAAALVLALPLAALAGATPEQKCEGGMNQEAGKYATCIAKAEKLFVSTEDGTKYGLALTKCEEKLVKKWDKLEDGAAAKGAVCPSVTDQADVESFLDACGQSVAAALAGGTLGLDPVACAADLATCDGDLGTCTTSLSSCESLLSGFTFERADVSQEYFPSGCGGVLSAAAPGGLYTVTGTITIPCSEVPGQTGPFESQWNVGITMLGPDYEGICGGRPFSSGPYPFTSCGTAVELPPLTDVIPDEYLPGFGNDNVAGPGHILVWARSDNTTPAAISFSVIGSAGMPGMSAL